MKQGGAQRLDYVHGNDVVDRLGAQVGNAGLLPAAHGQVLALQDRDPGWCAAAEDVLHGRGAREALLHGGTQDRLRPAQRPRTPTAPGRDAGRSLFDQDLVVPQCGQRSPQNPAGRGAVNVTRMPDSGCVKLNSQGMQRGSCDEICGRGAVQLIAQEGEVQRRRVRAHLMRAPCQRTCLEQRRARETAPALGMLSSRACPCLDRWPFDACGPRSGPQRIACGALIPGGARRT